MVQNKKCAPKFLIGGTQKCVVMLPVEYFGQKSENVNFDIKGAHSLCADNLAYPIVLTDPGDGGLCDPASSEQLNAMHRFGLLVRNVLQKILPRVRPKRLSPE